MKTKIIFGFILLLLVSSCKDDVPQMLMLHAPQQVDNTIILNWEEANVSGFQYYMVMRSSDQKRYDVINDIVTPTSDAFRKDITTFEDNTYPLGAATLYYKIMAIGDETVSSQNLCYWIEHPAILLKGGIRDMYYIKGTNKFSVLLEDNSNYRMSKLKTFDLRSGQFSSIEENIDGYSLSSSWYFWGEYNGKTEFYNYNGWDYTLTVYDATTFQSLLSVNNSTIRNNPSTCNNRGVIYSYSGYFGLYMTDRATGSYTRYQTTNYVAPSRLYYNSKDLKLYAVDYINRRQIHTFNLDEQGNVSGEEIYDLPGVYSSPLYIENSSLFVISTNSGVKILDMDTKTLHNPDLTQVSNFVPNCALLHNDILYVSGPNEGIISISNNPRIYPIYQLSVGDFKMIKTTPVRVAPMKFFMDGEYLYFFGQYGYEEYLLDKIKL